MVCDDVCLVVIWVSMCLICMNILCNLCGCGSRVSWNWWLVGMLKLVLGIMSIDLCLSRCRVKLLLLNIGR